MAGMGKTKRTPRQPTEHERSEMHTWTADEIALVEKLLRRSRQDFGDAMMMAASEDDARLVGHAWAEALWASHGDRFATPTGPMTYKQACEAVAVMSDRPFRP